MTKVLNAEVLLNKAMERTQNVAGEYFDLVLEQRLQNSSIRAGSFFEGIESKEELLDAILEVKWTIHSGSPEEGKVVLCTTDFDGRDGVLPISEVKKENLFFVNPKNIPGREEYAIYVDSDEAFPKTNETWLIISYFNPKLGEVVVDEPFIPTLFPGRYLEADDTVKGIGKYVKLMARK